MAKFSSLTSSAVTLSGATGTWATSIASGNVMGWDATINVQKIDATSKADNGWRNVLDGVKSVDGRIRMAADDTTPLSVTNGAPGVILHLYSNTRKISGTFRLAQIDLAGNEKGPEAALPTVTFAIQNAGAVTLA
jgi:hypothetical protein